MDMLLIVLGIIIILALLTVGGFIYAKKRLQKKGVKAIEKVAEASEKTKQKQKIIQKGKELGQQFIESDFSQGEIVNVYVDEEGSVYATDESSSYKIEEKDEGIRVIDVGFINEEDLSRVEIE